MKVMEKLRSLPLAERLQLVGELWDSIAEDSVGLQLTEAQRTEIDRRLDDFDAHPSQGIPWDVFRVAPFCLGNVNRMTPTGSIERGIRTG